MLYSEIEIFEYVKIFLGLFFIFKIIINFRELTLTIKDNKLFIFLVFYICASILWTADYSNTPRVMAFFVNISVVIFIVSRFELIDFLKFLRIFFAFILTSCYIAVFIFPHIGIDSGLHFGSWNGVFSQKNRTGIILVYSLITSITLLISSKNMKKMDIIMIIATLFFVLNTTSSTAILISTLCIFISLIYVIFLKYDKKIRIISFLFAAVIILASYYSLDYLINLISNTTGKDMTLTGRTFIWDYLIDQNEGITLFLGHGYGYYWSEFNTSLYKFYSAIGFITTTAHNGYIDILLDLGYVGLLLFLTMYVFSMGKYLISYLFLDVKKDALWGILILSCMIPYNFSESLFISYNSLGMIFIFCSTLYASKILEMREQV